MIIGVIYITITITSCRQATAAKYILSTVDMYQMTVFVASRQVPNDHMKRIWYIYEAYIYRMSIVKNFSKRPSLILL